MGASKRTFMEHREPENGDYHEDRMQAEAFEKWVVSENMITHGGSFVKALGKALRCADPQNTRKIHDTFNEYWTTYFNNGEKL